MNIILLLTAITIADNNSIVTIDVPRIKGGASAEIVLRVNVNVKEGYHIQANELTDDALIPTSITLQPYPGIATGKAMFPSPKKFKLEGTENFLDVYDGQFEITIPLKTTQLKKGEHTLKGEFRYQACDNRICFFPKTIAITVYLEII